MQSGLNAPVLDILLKPLFGGKLLLRTTGNQADRFGRLICALTSDSGNLCGLRKEYAFPVGCSGDQDAGDRFAFFEAFLYYDSFG